ncbi:MAG: 23S rRNA (guanosine(2251)-2'-O)-methyltransferase RlmB [Oscillospiraceae bacterium]|jgi:23S rRNA (guanosine2251-2'-O)-methyltransferase|nr:23S rRNA (guanosine(2251)-2'-O)-methyltransferase RlmB [Oscillospiraceae bacterium]
MREPGRDEQRESDRAGGAPEEEWIVGRNAVAEALKSGRPIDAILVARGERSGSIGPILAAARERGAVIKEVDRRKLDFLCGHASHQGVAARAAARAYAELEDLFAAAETSGRPPFFVLLDEIEDPHNLGAILRTADAAGAHGLVIPKRRSAPLSAAVCKAAAGAAEYIPVARVPNLCAAMEEMKRRGIWIFGADRSGTPYAGQDLRGPVALVIGSEGKGLGRLVRERCDGLLALPMQGKISSLNASVAAGILMYEVLRTRVG